MTFSSASSEAENGTLESVKSGSAKSRSRSGLLGFCCCQVGLGKRAPDNIPALMQSRDRKLAGPSAPPQGLCLVRVNYGERKDYRARQEE